MTTLITDPLSLSFRRGSEHITVILSACAAIIRTTSLITVVGCIREAQPLAQGIHAPRYVLRLRTSGTFADVLLGCEFRIDFIWMRATFLTDTFKGGTSVLF